MAGSNRHNPGARMRAALLGAAAAFAPVVAAAHPHVWVTSRSDIVFDGAGMISAVRHSWTFDDGFSAYATQGLDEDGDGILTRDELQPLAQVNVESLHEFEFFTYLGLTDVDEVYGAFAEPVDYWLDYDGRQLTLHFTLPLKEPFDPRRGAAAIEVYDPTFFVDFGLAEGDPVMLVDAPAGCYPDVRAAEGFDPKTAEMLARIPADVRDLPPEILDLTSGNANTIRIVCE